MRTVIYNKYEMYFEYTPKEMKVYVSKTACTRIFIMVLFIITTGNDLNIH